MTEINLPRLTDENTECRMLIRNPSEVAKVYNFVKPYSPDLKIIIEPNNTLEVKYNHRDNYYKCRMLLGIVYAP